MCVVVKINVCITCTCCFTEEVMLAEENKNSGRKLRSDTSDTHPQLEPKVGSVWIKKDPTVEPAADTNSVKYVNLPKAPHNVSSLKLFWIIFSTEESE